jgi:hypothetical protein
MDGTTRVLRLRRRVSGGPALHLSALAKLGVQARAMCRAQARVAGDAARTRTRDAGRATSGMQLCGTWSVTCGAARSCCCGRHRPGARGTRRESPCRAHLVESWGLMDHGWVGGKHAGNAPVRSADLASILGLHTAPAGTPPALLVTSLGAAAVLVTG